MSEDGSPRARGRRDCELGDQHSVKAVLLAACDEADPRRWAVDEWTTMDTPDLWDALRDKGMLADDPDVRAAVRAALEVIDEVRRRKGHHHARRCAEAMRAALVYELQHPDTSDMSVFEDEFDDPEGRGGR